MTRHLIRSMQPGDCLDLVELNESFVECLNDRFRSDPDFQPAAHRCRVLHCPVENLPAETAYDVILSGLPMNNFAVAEVEHILGILRRLAAPGATVSFFEYMGIRRVKAVFSGRAERVRLRGIGQVVGGLLKDHEIRRDWIWSNVPPAWVHHVRLLNDRTRRFAAGRERHGSMPFPTGILQNYATPFNSPRVSFAAWDARAAGVLRGGLALPPGPRSLPELDRR